MLVRELAAACCRWGRLTNMHQAQVTQGGCWYAWIGHPLEASTLVLLSRGTVLSACLIDWLFTSCSGTWQLVGFIIVILFFNDDSFSLVLRFFSSSLSTICLRAAGSFHGHVHCVSLHAHDLFFFLFFHALCIHSCNSNHFHSCLFYSYSVRLFLTSSHTHIRTPYLAFPLPGGSSHTVGCSDNLRGEDTVV